jgi:hypothetical protein
LLKNSELPPAQALSAAAHTSTAQNRRRPRDLPRSASRISDAPRTTVHCHVAKTIRHFLRQSKAVKTKGNLPR